MEEYYIRPILARGISVEGIDLYDFLKKNYFLIVNTHESIINMNSFDRDIFSGKYLELQKDLKYLFKKLDIPEHLIIKKDKNGNYYELLTGKRITGDKSSIDFYSRSLAKVHLYLDINDYASKVFNLMSRICVPNFEIISITNNENEHDIYFEGTINGVPVKTTFRGSVKELKLRK